MIDRISNASFKKVSTHNHQPAKVDLPKHSENQDQSGAASKVGELKQSNSLVQFRLQRTEIEISLRNQLRLPPEGVKSARTPPPPPYHDVANDPAAADRKAREIVDSNGGENNLNTDAVGRALALIAKQNPLAAAELAERILNQDSGIKGDYRDGVAQSFVESLSANELRSIAQTPKGKELLQAIDRHLILCEGIDF